MNNWGPGPRNRALQVGKTTSHCGAEGIFARGEEGGEQRKVLSEMCVGHYVADQVFERSCLSSCLDLKFFCTDSEEAGERAMGRSLNLL